MCDHLKKNHCEEGGDVYDSDRPGPKGVPNLTCAAHCEQLQSRGYFVNPKCILEVKSFSPDCPEIEEARQRSCPLTGGVPPGFFMGVAFLRLSLTFR